MTWVIIIILILVVFFVVSNQKQNKHIEEHFISEGGFRKSFSTFTNHLENFYEMTFVNDTGRSFTYTKEINDTNGNIGKLMIGIKLDMRKEAIIFSKFQSKYKGEFLGTDVSGVNYNNINTIDRCINISLEGIRTQGVIEYKDSKSNIITNDVSKEFIEKWNSINQALSDTSISDEVDFFINNFYVPDLVSPQKFMENLNILNDSVVGVIENYGTPSIRDVLFIPPAFSKLFIVAYPDVYNWYQENAPEGKVEIHNKIMKLSDSEIQAYFQNPKQILEFYRSVINQYKKEGNKLETIMI